MESVDWGSPAFGLNMKTRIERYFLEGTEAGPLLASLPTEGVITLKDVLQAAQAQKTNGVPISGLTIQSLAEDSAVETLQQKVDSLLEGQHDDKQKILAREASNTALQAKLTAIQTQALELREVRASLASQVTAITHSRDLVKQEALELRQKDTGHTVAIDHLETELATVSHKLTQEEAAHQETKVMGANNANIVSRLRGYLSFTSEAATAGLDLMTPATVSASQGPQGPQGVPVVTDTPAGESTATNTLIAPTAIQMPDVDTPAAGPSTTIAAVLPKKTLRSRVRKAIGKAAANFVSKNPRHESSGDTGPSKLSLIHI